jgi:hypothetical protein
VYGEWVENFIPLGSSMILPYNIRQIVAVLFPSREKVAGFLLDNSTQRNFESCDIRYADRLV